LETNSIEAVVVLIDDDPSLRKSVSRLLEAQGRRVEAYESLEQFYGRGTLPQVGCAVLDLNLPGTTGLKIQEQLAVAAPTLPIVFLTGFGKVASSVRAMKAGAVDFLEKPMRATDLVPAVERAISCSYKLRSEHVELEKLRHRFESLTMREREVFTLITSGLLNKQAGADLGITEKTVKVHRARVMEKMRAGSLADLVKLSQRMAPKLESIAISTHTRDETGKRGAASRSC
jgi:FixJ family two-component response regulator